MTIPMIGNPKELDSRVIQKHNVVAVFGICRNTLCVQEHALQNYVSRGNLEKPDFSVLEKLYFNLSVSIVVKRKNATTYAKKHGAESVFRFEEGWIFVLRWIEQLGIWLLKTVFPIDDISRHPYEIRDTHSAIRQSAWTPA